MASFKAIDNRTTTASKFEALKDKLEGLQTAFLEETAIVIVLESPVDTGAYMSAHTVGRPSPYNTSYGLPKGQDYQTYADAALESMFADIAALEGREISSISFNNNALHANKVEYEHGYAPFATARASAGEILENAKSRVGLNG